MRTSIDGSSVPHHQTVRSVVKATHLLLCIADSEGLTAVQAAGAVGIPMGTAYHLLNTLLDEGMLSRDAARRYQLGPKIAALSVAFAERGPSKQLLLAVRQLAEATGETAYLSAWQDGHVVAVAAIEGSSVVRVGRIHTELRGHEHARASGKVMLAELDPEALDAYIATHKLDPLTAQTIDDEQRLRAELDAIRECGYAFDEAEFTPGVGCVSAPIHESGICLGCFTISAPFERFEQNRHELTVAVVQVAREVSHS
jgi:IclR family acetate operon transcriptional repressor